MTAGAHRSPNGSSAGDLALGERADEPSALLRMRGIRKSFGNVEVLKGIDFDVRRAEVHALVGENGAGKSTLMNILAGVHQPDSGQIEFNGRRAVRIPNERAAQQLGIAIVFQERSLFSQLTIAENIFVGRQPVTGWGRIDRRKLFADTGALLEEVGLNLPPSALLEELSPAQQQMVEIAKALSLHAQLIIFDEPTAALTETETRSLFRVIATLKSQQGGIVYISHRLEELFGLADRVTVLKDGVGQGTLPVSQTNADELIARMVGRELSLHRRHSDAIPKSNPVMLEVRNLNDAEGASGTRPFLRDIQFKVRGGEIVVLAGLAGAGRTELALSLFGARRRGSGEILLAGRPVRIHSPADAIAAGLGYASEERKEAGLFADMTMAHNMVAAQLKQFGSWWFNDRRIDSRAEDYRRKLRIASRHVRQPVHTLSGGNQQKVMLAKWLLVNPRVMIIDEPTRGIDVGAKAEVHALLHELARAGTAILVISSDLPEVLALADRILVMREGRISGELNGAEATEEKVMRLATITEGIEN